MLRRIHRFFTLVIVAISVSWPDAHASNIEREHYWAEQIVDAGTAGEPIWLSAASAPGTQTKFLALYIKPEQASTAGIILVHGRGVHPAWGFIENLREDLSETGWHTLSLQMPILQPNAPLAAYGETFPEAFNRIDAGIRYLHEQGVEHIVLLGHSMGAITVLAYAAEHSRAPLAGIIAIGASTVRDGNHFMQTALSLQKIHTPVVDIFGTRDLPGVVDDADTRMQAARQAKNTDYMQVRVKSANHFFSDRYDALKEHILLWLRPMMPADSTSEDSSTDDSDL